MTIRQSYVASLRHTFNRKPSSTSLRLPLRIDGWDISAFNRNNVDAGVEFYIKMLGFRPVET